MELTKEEIRKNYSQFNDKKIIRLATERTSTLRPEAVEILKEIINERGLSEDLIRGIDIQFKELSLDEVKVYSEILRDLPCPVCKKNIQKLNATMIHHVISFIIVTNYESELLIACPSCLDKANNTAIIKSVILGLWGLPWGPIRVLQSVSKNKLNKAHNRVMVPNKLLLNFVNNNIGLIEANKNNPKELNSIITYLD